MNVGHLSVTIHAQISHSIYTTGMCDARACIHTHEYLENQDDLFKSTHLIKWFVDLCNSHLLIYESELILCSRLLRTQMIYSLIHKVKSTATIYLLVYKLNIIFVLSFSPHLKHLFESLLYVINVKYSVQCRTLQDIFRQRYSR